MQADERRPIVAITTGFESARWGPGWNGQAVLLPGDYAQAVLRSGALPVVVPPDPLLADGPDDLLDGVDALLLSGGADIDPANYGQEPDQWLEETQPLRDAVELALVRRALERGIPILGICRGLQVLAVAVGGTLFQHLPHAIGHTDHRRRLGSFDYNRHPVTLDGNSRIAALEGAHHLERASHHHQGVDRVGHDLDVVAWSPLDWVPEAVEVRTHPFAIAVQWHPEIEEECVLIAALAAAANRERRTRRHAPVPPLTPLTHHH